MISDFTALRAQLANGRTSAATALSACRAQAHSAAGKLAYTHLETSENHTCRSAPLHLPLAGVAVSVKALFDVQGWVTHAGSKVLQAQPAATTDAVAVARLRAAGATLMGQTHMVEFAFSGVGTNPHYPTPAAMDALWGRDLGDVYVPGGSSSGAAASVASGSAWLGLGSDTGGSIRIPAALNGLVGFKSTANLVPLQGTLPLSSTLDTACALTRSVRDAITAHEILAARRITRSCAPLAAWRLAIPSTLMLSDLAPAIAAGFTRSIALLRQAGAHIEEIALPELDALPAIHRRGTLAAAESFAWHEPLLAQHGHNYDPRVRQRIEAGRHMSAADYLRLHQARNDWIAQVNARIARFDALLSPTTPITAPLLAAVAPASALDPAQDAARDAAFVTANALLLRNTSVVNMLDGCALSIPCHLPGELPMGLMLWHGADRDDALLNLGLLAESSLLTEALRQGAQRAQPLHC